MFWKLTALSASSPVDSVLDRENFTLEELLDEEEIIQECKALNSRLINFLRDRSQVEQLLHYIVDEAPEDADTKRAFKFPFVACEIFTCEIDVILKTLVEEEELMDLLFSFLEPDHTHSALLAGYFGKVVVCLMLRKAIPLMNYVKVHQDVIRKLVDLIGITSIMEVLVRLVGADDHLYPNSSEVMQWLADSCLLEMIVDKLNKSNSCEVHANAAETLCAITRTYPSPLATKLSSPSFVTRIFGHALEDLHSRSSLVNSLSVCISLLDNKRSLPPPVMYSFRNQRAYESPMRVNPDTVGAMLLPLGDLLKLLDVSSDENMLPTTFGELRPPLGKHRLKIVEFLSLLMKSGNEAAVNELVSSGAIRRIFYLLFEYPYNNAVHHHVESIVFAVLESKDDFAVNHLLVDCNLAGKILLAEKNPNVSREHNVPTASDSRRQAPRAGYFGHLTRIANKLIQLGNSDDRIHKHLEENDGWADWQMTVLQERNAVENVYRWACGRPSSLQDKVRDSDEEDSNDKDFDVAALANNLSQAFRYTIYDNDDAEGHVSLDRDEEDVYFDDETAEVVISSLRLGDEHGSLFTNSNWFAFQDDQKGAPVGSAPSEAMKDVSLNSGNSSSDDEVVVGDDEDMMESSTSAVISSSFDPNSFNGFSINKSKDGTGPDPGNEKAADSHDLNSLDFETPENDDTFSDRPIPEWVAWGEASDFQGDVSSMNPFGDPTRCSVDRGDSLDVRAPQVCPSGGNSVPNGVVSAKDPHDGTSQSHSNLNTSAAVPSLFEEDVEFVGVESRGTERAMQQALKEGIVGEAGPLKKTVNTKKPDGEEEGAGLEFNDANYWRVDQEVAVLE